MGFFSDIPVRSNSDTVTAEWWNIIRSKLILRDSNVVTKTTTYQATTSDDLILCTTSGGSFTVTLPTAVDNAGKVLKIKKADSLSNVVYVAGNGVQTVDGESRYILVNENQSVTVASNGANWEIIGLSKEGERKEVEITSATATTTADTYTDVTGSSITVQPGTQTIGYDVAVMVKNVDGVTRDIRGKVALTDSSNNIISGTVSMVSFQIGNAGEAWIVRMSASAEITPSASATYKLRIACALADTAGTIHIMGNSVTGTLTNPDNHSMVWAERKY